jgi:rfaE bifunctional protein kinase chain/domain
LDNLKHIFDKFKDVKVLIVGDIMLDYYIYGNVDRISPEAPVPVLNRTSFDYKLGGAGNVALNCKALGAEPTIISYIGDDEYGEDIKEELDRHYINHHMISNGKPTTVKKRVISGNTHLLRIDIEDTKDIEDYNEEILRYYMKEIIETDVVILSDYNKGLLTDKNINDLIDIALDNDTVIVVDPKVNNFKEYKGVDLIKPNLKEAYEGMKIIGEDFNGVGVEHLVKHMKTRLDVGSVMVTLSDKGVYWLGDEEVSVDAHKIELADPCGCGDTVISVASILKYLGIEDKLLVEISNIAGSMVCEHFGVVQVENEELLERCIKLKLK